MVWNPTLHQVDYGRSANERTWQEYPLDGEDMQISCRQEDDATMDWQARMAYEASGSTGEMEDWVHGWLVGRGC